jgi:hypothetical protein
MREIVVSKGIPMRVNPKNSVDEAFGEATDAEWSMIRDYFGADIVFYPDIFRHLVAELRSGKLDGQLGVTLH